MISEKTDDSLITIIEELVLDIGENASLLEEIANEIKKLSFDNPILESMFKKIIKSQYVLKDAQEYLNITRSE